MECELFFYKGANKHSDLMEWDGKQAPLPKDSRKTMVITDALPTVGVIDLVLM